MKYTFNDSGLAFPYSTESYAGMVGYAKWQCELAEALHPQTTLQCDIVAADSEAADYQQIRLVLIDITTAPPQQIIGFTLHELTHILGAIDGARCPSFDEYSPAEKISPDPSDAYWWFGVQGVFTLKPEGFAWDAMNGRCSRTDDPDLCFELEAIVEKAYVPTD